VILVHRSERADRLVEALGSLLLDPLDDPMTSEVVAVPTRGVERWLAQRLSHRLGAGAGPDGICANVQFPFPGSVVGAATSVACGFDPDSDPWPPDRSVWPLLELVDERLGEPWLRPLAAHLEAGSPPGPKGPVELRRFPTIRHLADLFDRYAVHRPDMVQSWAGRLGEGLAVSAENGPGEASEGHWQAELWRLLRRRIGVPSPAERLTAAVTRLVQEPDLLDLPRRLSLFGLTRLPASHLRILEAIGHHREVHLFLLHPSHILWDNVEAAAGQLAPRSLRRGDDTTVDLAANPLLRSWARDSREMQLVLQARGVVGGDYLPLTEPPPTEETLLCQLQTDVRLDRRPPGSPKTTAEPDARPPLDPDDDTLRVHSCHGRLRQVEVMRDAILHLLAQDPTLEPRDVIVMCPDIESFAPLIHAVFASNHPAEVGDGDPEPGPPELRVRLADRSIRQTNPILAVAAQLLELASSRVTASEVLDLAGREPVTRRFGFDPAELTQLERWVVGSGIRWGLDQVHREPWSLERVSDNTWQSGLDRLLLGVTMAEEEQRLFGGVLPVDDMSSGAVDLAGRFAEFIERLQDAVTGLQGRHTVGSWVSALCEATERLALAAPYEQWQHEQLRGVLGDVVESATVGSGDAGAIPQEESGVLLDLAEVRAVLDDRLRGRPTRANFRTGDLTVCTLVPMRSVPHRVIGLLGLDDGAFPRNASHDGDDLLLASPQVGDRDSRAEDRQLLLDALLAATEHLVITYEGRDPRTNQERSPCVPVAELLDVVDRTVRAPEESPHSSARAHVVIEHPLQSFDWRNFSAGQFGGDGPWGFDPVDLAGAQAHTGPLAEDLPFLSGPLERLDTQVIQLDSLVRFLEHPVRAFLRERLGWYGSAGGPEVKDELPVELDPLEQWGVGQRLLDALLSGSSVAQAAAAEQARGLLPPGTLAGHKLRDIEQEAEALAQTARQHIGTPATAAGSVEVHIRLPDGRALIGTVPDVYRVGGQDQASIVRCFYSRLSPRHRLTAWVHLLALTAANPELEVGAVTIGRDSGPAAAGPRVALATVGELEGTMEERRSLALCELAVLVDLYDRGLSEPLPLYTKTSERFVAALRSERSVRTECRQTWDFNSYSFGEAGQPEHQLVLGDVSVEDLLAEPARKDEDGPHWPREKSRLGRLARRLWEPLLDREHVDHRS
jgi:exodeoxyribonuclease V gamma subunit